MLARSSRWVRPGGAGRTGTPGRDTIRWRAAAHPGTRAGRCGRRGRAVSHPVPPGGSRDGDLCLRLRGVSTAWPAMPRSARSRPSRASPGRDPLTGNNARLLGRHCCRTVARKRFGRGTGRASRRRLSLSAFGSGRMRSRVKQVDASGERTIRPDMPNWSGACGSARICRDPVNAHSLDTEACATARTTQDNSGA
jgi:hypothetical protein